MSGSTERRRRGWWRRAAVPWIKTQIYRCARFDAWLDRTLGAPSGSCTPGSERTRDARPPFLRQAARAAYLRLFPERRVRAAVPSIEPSGLASPARLVRILCPFPPEDGGGGSRPAQLAAELRRRGVAVEWTWSLPIFPWPHSLQPQSRSLRVHFSAEVVEDRSGPIFPGDPEALAAPLLVCAPHPTLVEIALRSPAAVRVIYDVFDLWDGELGEGWYDPDRETALLRRADVLVASSTALREQLQQRTGRAIVLLQNAVDPLLFDPDRPGTVPADLRPGRPAIGYVGTLWGSWVDFALLAELADAFPHASIHLVGPGPSRPPFERPNVHWLGGKSHHQIPSYIRAFDVALIPFVESRLTEAVSPLKAYEYLAMGKPVVATPLPDLAGIPGVRIASRGLPFRDAVAEAASQGINRARVASFVAHQTWSERVDRLWPLLFGPEAQSELVRAEIRG